MYSFKDSDFIDKLRDRCRYTHTSSIYLSYTNILRFSQKSKTTTFPMHRCSLVDCSRCIFKKQCIAIFI